MSQYHQHNRKTTIDTQPLPHSDNVTPLFPDVDGPSIESISKLRALISELMREVESLDEKSLPLPDVDLPENKDCINFYDEIARFETALIKRALRRTNGHQLLAARLLNLNPSTLHAKIKQYGIRSFI